MAEHTRYSLSLPPSSIYLVFFLVAYVENIVPPIPGDVLVAFGGYLAAESVIGLVPVLLLTTIASVIGFMSMYWIGSRWGTLTKKETVLAASIYTTKIHQQGSVVDATVGDGCSSGQSLFSRHPIRYFINGGVKSHPY